LLIKTEAVDWQPTDTDGISEKLLYSESGHAETVRQIRMETGTALSLDRAGGTEIFVMEGATRGGDKALTEGAWLRYPSGSPLVLEATMPTTLYIKAGHLADG